MNKILTYVLSGVLAALVLVYLLCSYYFGTIVKNNVIDTVNILDNSPVKNFDIKIKTYDQGWLSSKVNITMIHPKFKELNFDLDISHQPISYYNGEFYFLKNVIIPRLYYFTKEQTLVANDAIDNIVINALNPNLVKIKLGSAFENLMGSSISCAIYREELNVKSNCNLDFTTTSDNFSTSNMQIKSDFVLKSDNKNNDIALNKIDINIMSSELALAAGTNNNVRLILGSPELKLKLDGRLIDLFLTLVLSNNKYLSMAGLSDLKADIKLKSSNGKIQINNTDFLSISDLITESTVDNNTKHTFRNKINIAEGTYTTAANNITAKNIELYFNHQFDSLDVLSVLHKAILSGNADFTYDIIFNIDNISAKDNKNQIRFNLDNFNINLSQANNQQNNKIISGKFGFKDLQANFNDKLENYLIQKSNLNLQFVLDTKQCLKYFITKNADFCEYSYITKGEFPSIVKKSNAYKTNIDGLNFDIEYGVNKDTTGIQKSNLTLRNFSINNYQTKSELIISDYKSNDDFKQIYKNLGVGTKNTELSRVKINSLILKNIKIDGYNNLEQTKYKINDNISVANVYYNGDDYGKLTVKNSVYNIDQDDYNKISAASFLTSIFIDSLQSYVKAGPLLTNKDALDMDIYKALLINFDVKNTIYLGLDTPEGNKGITLDSYVTTQNMDDLKNSSILNNINKIYNSAIDKRSEQFFQTIQPELEKYYNQIKQNFKANNILSMYEPFIQNLITQSPPGIDSFYDLFKKMGLIIYDQNQIAIIDMKYESPNFTINNNTVEKWTTRMMQTLMGQNRSNNPSMGPYDRMGPYAPNQNDSEFKSQPNNKSNNDNNNVAQETVIMYQAKEAGYKWKCNDNQVLKSLTKDNQFMLNNKWKPEFKDTITDEMEKKDSSFCLEKVIDGQYKIQAKATNIYLNAQYLNEAGETFNSSSSTAGIFSISGVE